MGALTAGLIEWGVASVALPGEVESGDLHVVAPFPDGVLVAVIDGLGHGAEAAAAARVAAVTLQEHAHEPVISLVRRCDQSLRATRGAVIGLVSFSARNNSLTWLAVGNVEGFLIRNSAGDRPRETVLQRAGVVGYSLPPLRADVIEVGPGDTLVLATDGMRSGFAEGLSPGASPQHLADHVLGQFSKGADDALVLVARYKGVAP